MATGIGIHGKQGWSAALGRVTRHGDRPFSALLVAAVALVILIIVAIGIQLWQNSALSRSAFGLSFLWTTTWDPVHKQFGALPFILGTLETSLVALLMAIPISLGIAIFLAELAPHWLRTPLGFLVELLAAVPSVVYGLWGLFVLVPTLVHPVASALNQSLGFIEIFKGPVFGPSRLAAAVVLAIMIMPTISAVSRDVLLAIPPSQREAALALGATEWETIGQILLPYGLSGILGAVILGLGRALGETMAVTMVVGNNLDLSASILHPGYTMSSIIVNEFTEATYALYTNALIEIGLVLFILTLGLNAVARLLVWRVAQTEPGDIESMTNIEYSNKRRFAIRRTTNAVMMALSGAATVFAIVPLLWILTYVVQQGGSYLTLDFFTKLPTPVGIPGGGVANAIAGTVVLVLLASIMAIPPAILCALYAAAHPSTALGVALRFGTDVLAGVPSIVVGIFAYTVVVLPLQRFSALAGGFALSLIMLPTVIRSTEEMLKLVPRNLREASLALGAPEWKTSLEVLLPAAFDGIVTGIMLGVARVAGEAAPLLLTAFGNPTLSLSVNQPIASLPQSIFLYAISPYKDMHNLAWTTALVLVLLVLILNAAARLLVTWRRRKLGV